MNDNDDVLALLLRRQGLLVVEPSALAPAESLARAFELEMAALGYALSTRLSDRLARQSPAAMATVLARTRAVLAAGGGADRKHVPLFARFPEGIPEDTEDLWWTKIIVHFAQAEGQPCLFCRRTGTTHVLQPCLHVVCDRCFDGANYTACPVCEHHVDGSSPFFLPKPPRGKAREHVRFRLLDLTDEPDVAVRAMFVAFCERAQAMSPVDVADLLTTVRSLGARVLPWLPGQIPVKENVAHIFGTLWQHCPPDAVLAAARPHLRTATDVLRMIAVMSGADASLMPQTLARPPVGPVTLKKARPGEPAPTAPRAMRVRRFRVARLSRAQRRALLGLLESMNEELLVEDMLRYRAQWVWLGELLHPHDYARQFPKVAAAFLAVRGRDPMGKPAPVPATFSRRVERALAARDVGRLLATLEERPGELARRFDLALRLGADAEAQARVVRAFERHVGAMSTPLLVTLSSFLPTRRARAPIRVFWPKAKVSLGTAVEDTRAPLSADAIAAAVRAVEAELLARFARKPPFDEAVVDDALATVMVPFNERSASRAALALTRGSRIDVPDGKVVRLFLHWCEPPGGATTDIDLSVAFYDDAWGYLGTCSYYELVFKGPGGGVVARSAGDLRSAPHPDGATELVDIDVAQARALGARWAVMVVNNYRGLAFSALERSFAGLMLRDDVGGEHFDARTVTLKFDLQGDNGIFMPCALDLRERTLHWLDAYSKGALAFNNVATSTKAITTVCPRLIAYFGSGVRASMRDLALLHAAARSPRVHLRAVSGAVETCVRRRDEGPAAFLRRLREGAVDESSRLLSVGAPCLAALYRGDVELPARSQAYALFRERVVAPMAAAELLS